MVPAICWAQFFQRMTNQAPTETLDETTGCTTAAAGQRQTSNCHLALESESPSRCLHARDVCKEPGSPIKPLHVARGSLTLARFTLFISSCVDDTCLHDPDEEQATARPIAVSLARQCSHLLDPSLLQGQRRHVHVQLCGSPGPGTAQSNRLALYTLFDTFTAAACLESDANDAYDPRPKSLEPRQVDIWRNGGGSRQPIIRHGSLPGSRAFPFSTPFADCWRRKMLCVGFEISMQGFLIRAASQSERPTADSEKREAAHVPKVDRRR
ncbi:hypothetical protein EJ04DRAFT_245406 [Polyplosphaeria fusca]|uniref:Uncharacterized protein n=1 Tax=Polyplosphaeria fusca TaxID=682080 RepID=A0A9P4R0C5_9PLEO|nr:hypothetical protein EJ04DRAFT_245406 [Polyplosphaeria fusca]